MKSILYSMAGLLMVGSLPAVAQAGHRGGGSHWGVSIGFGQSSYNSWSSANISFGEGRGHGNRGNWGHSNWSGRYSGRYYSTPSYRYYQPRTYCPPPVVYSPPVVYAPPPVVYTPPVVIYRPPVVYDPPCYNYPSGTYYDVNIGFSYGR